MSVDPMAQFRFFLSHLDAADVEHQLRFFRMLAKVPEDACEELAPRLGKPITSADFRLLACEAAFYYPGPDWLDPLARLLRRESDPRVFRSALMALCRIDGDRTTEALKELYQIRTAPSFQDMVAEALASVDAEAAFGYHLEQLLKGSADAQAANHAGGELSRLMRPERLASILPLVRHEDVLVAKHALRLVVEAGTRESAAFLFEHFQETHQGVLEDRAFREVLADFRAVPVADQQAWAFALAEKHLGADAQEALATLRVDPAAAAVPPGHGRGGALVADVLAMTLDGRGKQIAQRVNEESATLQKRTRFAGPTLDACAEGLADAAARGLLPREGLLAALYAAFQAQTGGAGTAKALGALIDPADRERCAGLLACNDNTLRAAALDQIGCRCEEAFLDFLLDAGRDPLVELAERVLVYAGRLPGAQAAAERLLQHPDPARTETGIHLASLNRMAGMVGPLAAFVDTCTREPLQLEALAALGRIGGAAAIEVLTARLHSGQSGRAQAVLAEALKTCGGAAAAAALATVALPLRNPEVSAQAVEALAAAHTDPAAPLPADQEQPLLAHLRLCWEDRDPWPYRIRIIQALGRLNCASPALLAEAIERLAGLLADRRNKSAWSAEAQGAAQSVLRSLEARLRG